MPAATERLFFAVRPDARTAARIEALAGQLRASLGLRGKSLGAERFHVTLHLVGDFAGGIPPPLLDALLAAARPVASRAAPFDACFDTVASFTRKRRNMPFVLRGPANGVECLARLQQRLLAALTAADLVPEPEPGFTPHLTLLYDDIPVAPRPVEPLSWQVDALLLVRSLLGRSRHEVLARLPLGA